MSRSPEKSNKSRIWTPANIVTLIRICLVPLFVIAFLSPWPEWFGVVDVVDNHIKSLIAAGVFILISCTDWIDGYLARSRGEITDFGKFMDPLADKILVAAALLALIELQVLPSWPVLIILTREFIVSGIRMLAASKGVVIAASWYGKAKTVLQIIAIILFIIKDNLYLPNISAVMHDPLYIVSWTVMIAALVFTVISMFDYIAKAAPLLGFVNSSRSNNNDHANALTLDEQAKALSEEVVSLASQRGVTIASAESLTGGLICSYLTDVPGSSAVVKGSIVSYVNSVKHGVLGVSSEVLEQYGAVSKQTAMQMAEGVARKLKSDITVSVTGIAGPTGGEPDKPVGTVWIGQCNGAEVSAEVFHFDGDRNSVRLHTVITALEHLLNVLKVTE